MNELFFELIRVSIGTQDRLSRIPSEAEWEELYDMAEKQSLVGICFIGLKRLGADAEDGFERIGISEAMYMGWMIMAGNVQTRNEIVNNQCVEVMRMVREQGQAKGMILKGQGVGTLYKIDNKEEYRDLQVFRSSGDIDLMVAGGLKGAKDLLRKLGQESSWDYVHGEMNVCEDTSVEIHHRAGCLQNLWANHKFQRWVKNTAFTNTNEVPLGNAGYVTVPSIEFNSIFLLTHIYKHMFSEGLGMRQMMDYYFALREYSKDHNEDELLHMVRSLGMEKFFGGICWIINHVFEGKTSGTNTLKTICCSHGNEKVGRFILDDIMTGGNFGRFDEAHQGVGNRQGTRMITHILRRNWHYFSMFPIDVLWSPVWMLFQSVYRKVIVKLLEVRGERLEVRG